MVASGDKVVIADAEVPDAGPLVLQADITWRLQAGDKPAAYHVLSQQCSNYLRENCIAKVLVKASATSRSGVRLAHFHSAELRGIVQAAAASVCEVKVMSKAALSRNFGERKVDEYTKDDDYWDQHFTGESLRAGSREAALMLLAERGQN
jgi:hypothetical protein